MCVNKRELPAPRSLLCHSGVERRVGKTRPLALHLPPSGQAMGQRQPVAAGCPSVRAQPRARGRAGQLMAAAGSQHGTVPLPSGSRVLSEAPRPSLLLSLREQPAAPAPGLSAPGKHGPAGAAQQLPCLLTARRVLTSSPLRSPGLGGLAGPFPRLRLGWGTGAAEPSCRSGSCPGSGDRGGQRVPC